MCMYCCGVVGGERVYIYCIFMIGACCFCVAEYHGLWENLVYDTDIKANVSDRLFICG